jgi:hypothetical protein
MCEEKQFLIYLNTLYSALAQTNHKPFVKGLKSKEIKISLHCKQLVIKTTSLFELLILFLMLKLSFIYSYFLVVFFRKQH